MRIPPKTWAFGIGARSRPLRSETIFAWAAEDAPKRSERRSARSFAQRSADLLFGLASGAGFRRRAPEQPDTRPRYHPHAERDERRTVAVKLVDAPPDQRARDDVCERLGRSGDAACARHHR